MNNLPFSDGLRNPGRPDLTLPVFRGFEVLLLAADDVMEQRCFATKLPQKTSFAYGSAERFSRTATSP
jgi:hypothetical protein